MKKFTPILLTLPLLLLTACNNNNSPTDVDAPEVEVQVEMTSAETGTPPPEEPNEDPNEDPNEQPSEEGASMEVDENAVIFNVAGENMKFLMDGVENPELKVKQGDTVQINFTSNNGFHDWVIDEFDANTSQVQTGDTSSVTFVADKKGTFEYYCSVGNHRAQGMKGMLVVE